MLLRAAEDLQLGKSPEIQERSGKEGACSRVEDWEVSKGSREPE